MKRVPDTQAQKEIADATHHKESLLQQDVVQQEMREEPL